ncbi:Defect at low temperature protein 1 [Escovopsis weberi]|uniref:Defect at low temperature protein 1 n=1 Tax=Escovopsis weberi TaxID=150374 RepID=A0A0M9VW98_ESCWE|nr:Defect at low temperature protein 1 [Escovopsis weberi]
MARRDKISQFIYRSVYFILYIILLGLLLITPGDIIDRSVHHRQYFNIWILVVAYIVTILAVCFVYALRLYINKTALTAIPRAWVPIEKGDVKQSVHRMIETGLSRSAAITYAARPRVEKSEQGAQTREHARHGPGDHAAPHGFVDEDYLWRRKRQLGTPSDEVTLCLSTSHRPPVWGIVEHDGWSSPNSSDVPNLHYKTVLSEVPNLIEAKALTLAPPDPTYQNGTPVMNPEAVGLLQRLPHMSLRDYLMRLAELGVVTMDGTTSSFLAQYERARFSTRAVSGAQFRQLMHLFANLLRAMRPLDPSALDREPATDDESDIDDDAPATEYSSQRSYSRPSTSSSHASSVRRPLGTRSSYRTAPDTPGLRLPVEFDATSQRSGTSGGTHVRRPLTGQSSVSLQSRRSDGSRSLMRLATCEDNTDLPYVLSLRDSSGSAY